MATLTIHDVDEKTMRGLRQLATRHDHPLDEEARRILNRAVDQSERKGLGTRISKIFAEIGGVDLEIPARSAVRPAPDFSDELE